jgi:hypothetical protein
MEKKHAAIVDAARTAAYALPKTKSPALSERALSVN